VPLTISGEIFRFENDRYVEAEARVDIGTTLVTAGVRTRNSDFAHSRIGARLRLGRTTTLHVEIDERRDSWFYDYVMAEPQLGGDSEDRVWLRLGPILTRRRASARFGTVLLGNFDVLLFGTAAIENDDDETHSSFLPTYYEAGAAVEARFRHSTSAGVELRTRRYVRADPEPGADADDPDHGAWGEESFREGVATVRYAAGARRFSFEAAGVLRVYETQTVDGIGWTDLRSGTRFRIEAWAAKRFRVLGEYEVVSVRTRGAPDLEGVQSLRLMGEAAF
jgi:hypothetical protein